MTERWIDDRKAYPVAAEGDTVAVAREILRKYCPVENPKNGTLKPDQFTGNGPIRPSKNMSGSSATMAA